MKHPATQALYSYWTNLRGERAAPERGDVDPVAIRGVLADTFLIEVECRTAVRRPLLPIRLSGTRINALFERELKGQDFLDLWRREDQPQVADLIMTVLDDTCAAVGGIAAAPKDYPSLGLEMLLLPLRHHGKTHARLLGSIAPSSIPQWLGLLPSLPLGLVTQRMLNGPFDLAMGPIPSPGRMGMSRAGSDQVRRGHLRLYEGGRTNEDDADARRKVPLTL